MASGWCWMVMNLQDSCSNHHPTTTRGFRRTVNWNLNGAEKRLPSDECGSHNHSIGGLAYAQTSGLGSALPQCGLFSLSADEPRQRERHLYLFDPERQTAHLPL